MPCTASMIALLAPFRPLFTAPTWKKMLTLLSGTLLAHGRRTVTAALWHTGQEQDPHFSAFHQVLNRARWSPLQASRRLLALLIETFVLAGGTLDIVIDETLERRWGAKIRKRGHYRDSVRSSHERSVSSPGLRWIVLAVGGGRTGALDHAALGFAVSVCVGCVGDHPAGQRTSGPTPQDAGGTRLPSGQPAAALVAASAHEAPGRSGLQRPRIGTALPPAARYPDCPLAPGASTL